MFLVRLFFIILTLFSTLVLMLGALLWVKMRRLLRGSFVRRTEQEPSRYDNVIEGEYQIVTEPSDNSDNKV